MNAIMCPACTSTKGSAVKDSRIVKATVRRRRTCLACGHRWTTIEISEQVFKGLVNGDSVAHRNRVIKRIAEELLGLTK